MRSLIIQEFNSSKAEYKIDHWENLNEEKDYLINAVWIYVDSLREEFHLKWNEFDEFENDQ